MRIEADKYLLTHDGDQFILQTKSVVKDSALLKDKSKIGELQVSSEKRYFPKIAMAFNAIVYNELAKDDEVKTMLDISMKIDEIGHELNELVRGES